MREYFSHDYNARNDKKLVALFMKHGLAGVGAFWCLVEMLYESNGVILRSECDRIAFELRITNEFLNSILCDFDLFICDENAFYSESVKTRLGLRNEKSEKAKASAIARWSKKSDDANALRSQCEGNAIKEKKSKLNKSKVSIYPFDVFWDAYGKKQDKEKCLKKWESLTEEEQSKAMSVVDAYVKSKPDLAFRKNPLTWINGKCWNDDIIPTNNQNPTTSQQPKRNPRIITKTSYDGFKFD